MWPGDGFKSCRAGSFSGLSYAELAQQRADAASAGSGRQTAATGVIVCIPPSSAV
jgi:hypothetical protein